jgi:hypothetical protein
MLSRLEVIAGNDDAKERNQEGNIPTDLGPADALARRIMATTDAPI